MKDLFVLNASHEWRRYREWLTHYCYSKGWENFLLADQSNVQLTNEERKEMSNLIALLYQTIGTKYHNIVTGLKHPSKILLELEKSFGISKFSEIEDLEEKLNNLRYSKEPEKFYPYLRGLINKYKALGGTLTDHYNVSCLLKVYPDNVSFTNAKINLNYKRS